MAVDNRIFKSQTTGTTFARISRRNLFGPPCPAAKWVEEEAKHALDELFNATALYRKSQAFRDLVKFVKDFRFYSHSTRS